MLQERGVKLRSLAEHMETETATGQMMFDLLGTIAEYSLDLNRERIHAGLKAGLAWGRKGGRLRRLSDANLATGPVMIDAGAIPIAEIAKCLGVSARTFYHLLPTGMRAQPSAPGGLR